MKSSSLFLNQQGNFVTAGGGGATLQSVKVSLTSAQILNSNTTPVQLIAAPGAGKFIQVLSVIGIYNFNTIGYTLGIGVNPTIAYGSSTSSITSGFTGINAGASRYMVVTVNSATLTSSFVNQVLNFYSTVSNPTNGDGTLDIYISYQIISI